MGMSKACDEGLSSFLKIKWRARYGASKLDPSLFQQAPSYAPHTQQTVSRQGQQAIHSFARIQLRIAIVAVHDQVPHCHAALLLVSCQYHSKHSRCLN